MKIITLSELRELLQAKPAATVFLDVRTPAEFAEQQIPGFQNVPLDQLAAQMEKFTGKKIVITCRSGKRAKKAATLLESKIKAEVLCLAGGLLAWQAAHQKSRPAAKTSLWRHVFTALLAGALLYAFWLSRPDWSGEMRFWRAVGDAGFTLLVLMLAIGSSVRIWPTTARLLLWRRPLGIWFALLVLSHTYLILDGWLLWDWQQFFGYQFIPELGSYARMEPGFGLANLLGLVAAFWALILLAVSSDRATRFLGPAAWKWLNYGAYLIFYLTALHMFYFLFIHYTPSFHRPVLPDPNWFRYPFLVMIFSVLALQFTAFVVTVRRYRRSLSQNL